MTFSQISRKYYLRLSRYWSVRKYSVVTFLIFSSIFIGLYCIITKIKKLQKDLISETDYDTKSFSDWKLGGYAYKKESIQDVICSDLLNGTCYIIADEEKNDEKHGANRMLLANTLYGGVLSLAELIATNGEAFSLKNSAKWDINYKKLVHMYIRVMASAPFITDTINSETQDLNLLFVGLGGASLNNFFYNLANKPKVTVVELDPAMVEVARKWFGVKESPSHKILTEDGAKLLRNYNKNQKFDAIFIDACYNDANDELTCPVKEFRTQEIISIISKNLSPKGTVVINAVSFKLMSSGLEKLLKEYQKYFPTCFYLGAGGNFVLICTKHKLASTNRKALKENLKKNMPKELQKENSFILYVVSEKDLKKAIK